MIHNALNTKEIILILKGSKEYLGEDLKKGQQKVKVPIRRYIKHEDFDGIRL
jgi:hypothetical protein